MSSPKLKPLLSVENLELGFAYADGVTKVVNNISYQLNPGEILAIVGESGSGKSVSSLAILGLLPRSARILGGDVKLNGSSILKLKESDYRKIRGGKIAMIFQEPMTALTPVLTIGEQLLEGILCHQKISIKVARQQALEMLEYARIPEPEKRMKQYPHQLSGGMRQRVMIAMALACRPDILIADEPTTALDVTIQAQILSLMKKLQEDFGTAIILVTHDMGVVAEMANRVLVMCRGEAVEQGLVQDIFASPQNAYTQRLLAAVPKLGATTEQQKPVNILPQKQSLIEVDKLSIRFDIPEGLLGKVKSRVHAVENVSFSIDRGETLALVGESGSGKSTIGRGILNLVPISGGAVRYQGRDISNWSANLMRPLRRELQMVFQDPMASLNPRKKVGALVAEPMKIHGMQNNKEREQYCAEIFERVGLSADDMQRFPHQFSGGQRQRICIARALITNPGLIVADECVSALDVSVQAQIIDLMKTLQKEMNLSYLFISHDLAVVEQISHRIAVLYMGQIVELGETQDILHNPQHPYTVKLLESVPIADPARASLTRKGLITGEIPSPVYPLNAPPRTFPLIAVPGRSGHWVAESTGVIV